MKRLLTALLCGFVVAAVTVEASPAAPGDAVVAKKKCKKKRAASAKKKKCRTKPATPAPPGPGGSISPPAPPPDPCPGFTICPATIYQINQGAFPNGTKVRITAALATATMGDGSAFWVQVKNAGTTDFSGLEVASGGLPVPSPGLTLTIDGTVGTHLLTALQIQNTGAPIEPADVRFVAAAFFADDVNAAALDGSLVGVTAPGTLTNVGNDWSMSTGFTVAHRIIGTLPSCPNGTTINQVVGIADIEGGDLVLLPTSASSINPSSCP